MTLSRIALAASAAMLLAAGCATSPPARNYVLPLVNPGFEAELIEGSNCPDGWGCVMHANPTSYKFRLDESAPASGKRSLCIEPLAREPWARAIQTSTDLTLRGKKVRFSINVKAEGAERGNSEQGVGAFIAVLGGRGEYLGTKMGLTKSTAWQRVQAEIVVPANGFIVEYGVLLSGPGKVCADDARVEVVAE